jgi:hypothetical protein
MLESTAREGFIAGGARRNDRGGERDHATRETNALADANRSGESGANVSEAFVTEASGSEAIGSEASVEPKSGPGRALDRYARECTSPSENRVSSRPNRRKWPGAAVTLALVWGVPTPAVAEPIRSVDDLDGTYLWVGPTGAATHVDGRWDSLWGGGVQVLRVREHKRLTVYGVWLGGAHYATGDGGRLWIDGVIGTRAIAILGLSLGPVVELGAQHHPRLGAAVTVWGFTGVTPTIRIGALQQAGAFVELGVSLSLPAIRR